MNLTGVQIVDEMMRAELEPLGFDVSWVPQKRVQRSGHLIATHRGRPGSNKLLLIAHLARLRRGAGDISFVAPDVDGLVGMGTASEDDHAPGETVDLDNIRRRAKRAAILMTRLSRD